MHQQRRLSPAPSSPCPRIQQSNRMQFLQPYVQTQQPIVLKTEDLRPVPQSSQHHMSREREKENLNPKAFQSGRLVSQYDTPQQSQRSLQQIQVIPQHSEIKQLREEMLKMFEFHRKDNDGIKQELEQCKSELLEQKGKTTLLQSEIEKVKQELSVQKQINDQQRIEIDTQGKQLRSQKEDQEKYVVQQQMQKQELLTEVQQLMEAQLQQRDCQHPQQITLDTYDSYIQKYEQFNKQVNDYLLNRKLPDRGFEGESTTHSEDKKIESPARLLPSEDQIIMTKADMDKYKMSTIQENENEEDEIIYQVDENGYVMNQDGNHLVDNYGRLIQLSEKDIEYFKSKNQLDEIK